MITLRTKCVLGYALLLAAYVVLRLHTLLGELVHDDGLFLYGAQAWASGLLPYRDFWDHKPPGVFLFLSLPLRCFPFSLWAVKLHLALWLAAAALVFYGVCRRWCSRLASASAVALFVVWTSMRYTVQSGGLTEECGLVWVIFSYGCFWLTRRSARYAFLSGILLGIAIECRQTFLFEAIPLFYTVFHSPSNQKESSISRIKLLLAMIVGMILPEALFSLYFYEHGVWWDYFEASYLFNFFYIGPARRPQSPLAVLLLQIDFIKNTGPWLLVPFLALAMIRWIPRDRRGLLAALAITFLGDVLSISLSGEYYAHYYVQSAGTCCLLAAMAIEAACRALQGSRESGNRWLRIPAAIALFAVVIGLSVLPLRRMVSDGRQVLDDRHTQNSAYTVQCEIAAAVRRMTYPNDKILLIGRVPNSVYFLSGRYSASRYYHFSPLWKDKLQPAVQPQHRTNFLQDLHDHPPVILLLDLTRLENGDEWERVKTFVPEALEFLQEQYMPLDVVIPYFPEDCSWYDVRVKIMVWRENYKFVRYHYHWFEDNAQKRPDAFKADAAEGAL